QEAVKLYTETGEAPIIKGEGFLQYPYGESEPLITCLPLRACDVELEPGEEILNVALGDAERWIAQPAQSGGGKGASTPHLVIKPTDFNLMSNALIFTSRRTYHVALLSPPEGMTPAAYARRVRFYYPAELVQRFARSLSAEERAKQLEVAKLPAVTAESLDFDYEVSGESAAWRPVRAFDDGTHVYIQMPEAMRADEAPALLVSTSDGETLVNYRVKGRFYIVDKLFDEAHLVSGVGWNQDKVTIRYTGKRRS
ncbi:MAG: P-type conjugative transfer protein TrbG, partial [Candidatus Binatia bacterium]